MNNSSKTVWIFGVYLMLEGLFLLLAPNWIMETMGLPDPDSVWRIIVGFVVVVLGYYYIRNAKENLTPFFHFTVQVRILQLGFFLWLYFFERGTMILVALSAVEVLAGIWTWSALKKSTQS